MVISLILLMGCAREAPSHIKEGETAVNITNTRGNVRISDEKLAGELMGVVEDKRNMLPAACGFGNKVAITRNGAVMKSFSIADDGCPTILTGDGSIFKMPGQLYNRLELLLQEHNNSLAVNGLGKPRLLDAQADQKPAVLFAIHLVKDLTTAQAAAEKLDRLVLEERPVLVNCEIAEYDWADHRITLRNSRLEKELSGKVPVSGRPFVAVANGERIYLGAFWTPLSSLNTPDIPVIASSWLPGEENKVYRLALNAGSKDVRGDERIYAALKGYGVIKEPGPEPEACIFGLFRGAATEDKARQEIFRALPDLDWSKYEKVSQGRSVELLSWMDGLDIAGEREMTALFKATKNLDGAHAEEYATVVGKLYLRDKVKFIKYLGGMQYGDSKTEQMARSVAYYMGYFPDQNEKARADTEKLLAGNELSEREKIIAKKFIKVFEEGIKE
jgi:hypothetical protein